MKIDLAFWDTSAIIPLCCRQPLSIKFRTLARQGDRIVAWWGTTVEACAAIHRLQQRQAISEKDAQHGIGRIASMREQWLEIDPSEDVRELAEQLPEKYNLRALDAFQLAAALVWCKQYPKDRVFVCADKRLAAAAEEAGFTVLG